MISRGNRQDASSLGVSWEPTVFKLINSLNMSACMNKFTFLYLLLGPTTMMLMVGPGEKQLLARRGSLYGTKYDFPHSEKCGQCLTRSVCGCTILSLSYLFQISSCNLNS